MQLRSCVLSLAAASVAMLAGGIAQAATITYSTSAPDVVSHPTWVSSLTGTTNGKAGNVTDGDAANYLAMDRGSLGQTFTVVGSGKYTLDAIWLQHVTAAQYPNQTWYNTTAATTLDVRVTDPTKAGTTGFALTSETVSVTGTETNNIGLGALGWSEGPGTGTWVRFAFATPITVTAGTQYGFDVTSLAGGTYYFEANGTNSTTAYTGGSAYSGDTNGTVTNALNLHTGSHVFVAELTSVPEPASFALMGLAALGLVRRRSR